MAVTPGNRFALADLQALATQANALASANFDLTHWFDVAPMYLSGGSWGHRIITNVIVAAFGSGYVAGDLITLVFFSMIPIGIPVIFSGLHIVVALLQAYVFMLLSIIYVSGAGAEEH